MARQSEHDQRLLATHGITCSMSHRGDCWDNAPMDAYLASPKKELYTRARRHSSLGDLSPDEYERAA